MQCRSSVRLAVHRDPDFGALQSRVGFGARPNIRADAGTLAVELDHGVRIAPARAKSVRTPYVQRGLARQRCASAPARLRLTACVCGSPRRRSPLGADGRDGRPGSERRPARRSRRPGGRCRMAPFSRNGRSRSRGCPGDDAAAVTSHFGLRSRAGHGIAQTRVRGSYSPKGACAYLCRAWHRANGGGASASRSDHHSADRDRGF